MSDDDAFVEQIRCSPFDEATRLVYADWLQERDDPRAEFVRAESALAALLLAKERDEALAARYLDLTLALDERWVAAMDRVPKLLRSSIEAGAAYALTPRRGETMMLLLRGLFGPPAFGGNMSEEQFLRAVRENRAVTLEETRDGHGGGMVWVRRAEPWTDANIDRDLVFPCVITDAMLDCLRRNYWERMYEVFEPG